MATAEKAPGAFKTIGELSQELGVAQHILRYWETRFPQLRPMQRAGNRRYYRPDDVALARRIHRLLNDEGYTIRGVQKLLKSGSAESSPAAAPERFPSPPPPPPPSAESSGGIDIFRLISIRDRLTSALDH